MSIYSCFSIYAIARSLFRYLYYYLPNAFTLHIISPSNSAVVPADVRADDLMQLAELQRTKATNGWVPSPEVPVELMLLFVTSTCIPTGVVLNGSSNIM